MTLCELESISCKLQNSATSLQSYYESEKETILEHYYIRDSPKPSGYQQLPANVLVIIFMNLDEDILRKSVISVCHKWRQVALLPVFWRELKFRGLKVAPNYICQQLRTLSNLQCISLVDIPNAAPIIRQLCRCNQRIIKVEIKHCKNEMNQNRFPERVLRNMVASCRKLQEINLKGTSFYGNMFYIEVAVLPELKSINLSDNEYLKKKNIFELVLNCKNLEEFKISQNNDQQKLSDNDVNILFRKMQSTLKSISIDTIDLSDISFQRLCKCINLEKLYLYNATNLQPETFANIWKSLPYLENLKITHCQISSPYFVQLFTEGHEYICYLKTIDFTGAWKLNSAGVNAIAECCVHLEKAVFKNCKNLENINGVLENSKKLKYFNIAFCDKIPAEQIVRIPEHLPNLCEFYIEYERFDQLNEIKQKHPQLKINICLSQYNKRVQLL